MAERFDEHEPDASSPADAALEAESVPTRRWWQQEDWLAVAMGGAILAAAFLALYASSGDSASGHPWKAWIGKPGSWVQNPLEAFAGEGLASLQKMVGPFLVALFGFSLAYRCQGHRWGRFLAAFPVVFLLATLAYVMAGQETVKHLNLEYALWALLVGLAISNTIGVARWLRPAVATELYIKTGLVLLGAEVLLHRLIALGLPGIFVAWVVTPIVLITTFWFGQKILRIPSKSLNMVISADMSVCGVSAAIATAAACRAKKEELSFAVSISLIFTVIMMVVMPLAIRAMGISSVVGGAWMGGTIDSTGAVAAAGAALDPVAEATAATVKMIQNILIGVTAFGVAVYWVTNVDSQTAGTRPNPMEIWHRFPKFVLGFIAASIAFTLLSNLLPQGEQMVSATVKEATKGLRGWFFCLAFVSIGLDTRFAELSPYLRSGKPLVLYVCGQTLNLILTLLMAWLMFGVIFKDTVAEMLSK